MAVLSRTAAAVSRRYYSDRQNYRLLDEYTVAEGSDIGEVMTLISCDADIVRLAGQHPVRRRLQHQLRQTQSRSVRAPHHLRCTEWALAAEEELEAAASQVVPRRGSGRDLRCPVLLR